MNIQNILDEVETLCNDDQAPVMDNLKQAIEHLIEEAYQLGQKTKWKLIGA